MKFTPALNSTATGSFTVQAASTPSMGGLVASPVTASIAVDGPVITSPGLQSLIEDTTLVFSPANNNQIRISDTSVGSGTVNVSVSTTADMLTLGSLTGISIASGGEGESSIAFSGTVAAVNAALDGLTITFPSHFTGSDELGIIASDISNDAAPRCRST